jgi:hypothetical protein
VGRFRKLLQTVAVLQSPFARMPQNRPRTCNAERDLIVLWLTLGVQIGRDE